MTTIFLSTLAITFIVTALLLYKTHKDTHYGSELIDENVFDREIVEWIMEKTFTISQKIGMFFSAIVVICFAIYMVSFPTILLYKHIQYLIEIFLK